MNNVAVSVLVLAFTLSGVLSGQSVAADHEVPDPARAAGALNSKVKQSNIGKTICAAAWVKRTMPSAKTLDATKRKQLKAWGYPDQDPAKYEADHVIPVSVGGHPTKASNLWPQPYALDWNAGVKNKLEDYVHREVCEGRMSLTDGQGVFRKNWVEVFHLYCGPKPDAICNPPGSPVQIESAK